MVKTILFTGDSHTWGQGASHLIDYFNPPAVSGELRLAPFRFTSYVSLIREEINRRTGSIACEIEADALLKEPNVTAYENCVEIRDHGFIYNVEAQIIRIEFRCQSELSKAEIYIDGKLHKTVDLQMTDLTNPYKIVVVFCEQDGIHKLKIKSVSGNVLLYRIEAYSGEYAVINSGISSCPINRLLTDFWDEYIALYKPYIMVMEAHTINDWLTKETPEMYLQMLHSFIQKAKETGAIPILLTVSPIMGNQAMPFNNTQYNTFVDISCKAAVEQNILLVDANKAMMSVLDGLSHEQQSKLLFDDMWHVNDVGHEIYAKTILDTMIKQHII